MDVREATPSDAPGIETLIPGDVDADRLVRDRRVIVAESGDELEGCLSYDTWNGTVHVSTLVGNRQVVDALLAEPRRFAEREGFPMEIIVPKSDTDLQAAVEAAGFEDHGEGPIFEGEPSKRYRYST